MFGKKLISLYSFFFYIFFFSTKEGFSAYEYESCSVCITYRTGDSYDIFSWKIFEKEKEITQIPALYDCQKEVYYIDSSIYEYLENKVRSGLDHKSIDKKIVLIARKVYELGFLGFPLLVAPVFMNKNIDRAELYLNLAKYQYFPQPSTLDGHIELHDFSLLKKKNNKLKELSQERKNILLLDLGDDHDWTLSNIYNLFEKEENKEKLIEFEKSIYQFKGHSRSLKKILAVFEDLSLLLYKNLTFKAEFLEDVSDFSGDKFLAITIIILLHLDFKALKKLNLLILFYEENYEFTETMLGKNGYRLVTLMAALQYLKAEYYKIK